MAQVHTLDKWAAGPAYGPVLSQTDLYILCKEIQLHPILTRQHPSFTLIFNLLDGQPGGYNPNDAEHNLPLTQANEPATLPRVQELVIITDHSPWCTIVKNPEGVTLGDVFGTLWREYTDNPVTEAELGSCPQRIQDVIKRAAQTNQGSGTPWTGFYTPAASRVRRVDWLRDKVSFESMVKDDNYIHGRLGFSAPNIFLLRMGAW
ncbi:hypothetical protein HETIRDRAFT_438198 [Heterobasidion irregulare TC 32-1]|uniref:DUF6699 domain-containing protein n=1 Tax=Heterobasidion irregulare (strain TC 32-1) TaxID=747525 RepID=W4KH53_HETIT|nr:uncharacterized protein HETIRDRAFT_438198 [Heterobasidion irregulare TC 32-1]ETW85172.1 hypothetical protein HETIRDRAFT_438198 [Heterobasidion irregulare TC 32-1]